MTNHLARNATACALGVMASLITATSPAFAQDEPAPPAVPVSPAIPVAPVAAKVPGGPGKLFNAERAEERAARDAKNHDVRYTDRLQAIVRRADDQTLVIPKEAGDPKKTSEADVEDMNVMEHILEKALMGRDDNKHAMGMLIGGPFNSTGGARNLYLEGYGALFFLNVNYPLLPPPAVKEAPEAKDNSNAEWDEARREVHHESEPFAFNWSESGGPRSPTEEYTPEKVENLKKNLLIALKNTAHIRNLKSDETVTVIVLGSGSPQARGNRKKTGDGDRPGAEQRAEAEGKPGRLLLRARKSDAESFLKDKLSLDEFRRKATVFIY